MNKRKRLILITAFLFILSGAVTVFPQECSIRQTSAFNVLQLSKVINPGKDGGTSIFTLYDCHEALALFLKDLPFRRAEKDVLGEAWVLTQLGDIYLTLEKNQEAFDYYIQALRLFRELNNYSGKVETLDKLSYISKIQKNYSQSLQFLEEEIEVFRTSENQRAREFNEGLMLDRKASVYFAWGDAKRGFECLEKRLAFEREKKNEAGQSAAYEALGDAYSARGKASEAIKAYKHSLEYLSWMTGRFKADFLDQHINKLRAKIESLEKSGKPLQ